MTRTGSWSLKFAMALCVASLVWAGAASIAVRSLENRLRTPSTNRPVLPAPPPAR